MSYTALRATRDLSAAHAFPNQWASDFSEEIRVEAAMDTVAPATPSSFALEGIAEGITLTWDNPAFNDDGKPCYDLSDIAIYRSTSPGIDITNDGTYDKRTLRDGESYTFPASDTTQTYYFVITAIDTTGNESAASAELSDTSNKPIGADPVIPDDATGLIFKDSIGGDGVVEGYAMIGIAFQTPPSSVVGLRSIRLWYQYTDDAGSNWRDEDGVATQWTELFPPGLIGFLHKDTLLQTNIGTRAYRYKATFIGEDDTTESSTADTAGGTATVCAANNDNLVAISIFAMNIVCLGEVTADRMTVNDLAAINADLGAITAGSLNINDAFIVSAAGAVQCTNLEITGGSININTGAFTVSAAGAVECSDLTITGGTINLNSGVFAVDALGQVTCSNIQITGAGSTWGGAVFGVAYIPNLSTDKLTTGTLLVARTQAKCTDANADQTSVNTAANIAGQGGLATEDTVGAGDCDATIISGGKIITGLLSATNIQTGILTGLLIRTASSGERAEMAIGGAGAHGLRSYRSTGALGTGMSYGGYAIYDTTGSEIGFWVNTSNHPKFSVYGTQANIAANQSSSSGAISPCTLGQSDVSEGFIDFVGSDRGAYVVGSVTVCSHSVRAELNGTKYRLALIPDA